MHNFCQHLLTPLLAIIILLPVYDDEIIIEKANFPAQIVRFEDKNFYQTFMNKLCL